METIRRLIANSGIAKEFLGFLWEEKLWWMTPMVGVMLILGVLIASAPSAILPFIYTLF